MADQTKVDQFKNLTGVDDERAKFYIESAGGNVELAISSFYEEDGDDDMVQVPVQAPVSQPTVQASTQHGASGPPKQPSSHGAEEVGEPEAKRPAGTKNAFRGAGYRLGETEEDPIDVVQGAPIRDQSRKVDMTLKLWKNGFSINNGPLRDFKDPTNKEFLDSISKGEVPNELVREARGGEVSLDMEDHRTEDYVQPKVPVKAFAGEGHMLGSPAPNVVSGSPAASGSANDEAALREVSINTSQPTTNIQIRLADGTRLTAKLNHSHTVRDIRRYIVTARPQYALSPFVLLTTFPNKELTDESLTLQQANLLNAVIVQRVK
ncbi:UBX domain-containing protein 1 [Mytilus galloprovincialis]|uniref:UBX domain-containing protein 1 n=1 Tax=Mytilus galloprovincialis TaxID=29158 RepID=A0A8B6GPT2_MYTGA|nr:UBX domain-containing protein 1 [Mytilus galloprovincialis]